jgi:hypothetical protein
MEMRRRGKATTGTSSVQRTLHDLIPDPTRNIATTRMARPALMTSNGFRPAPRHSPVESPQRLAITTIRDITRAQPIEEPILPRRLAPIP